MKLLAEKTIIATSPDFVQLIRADLVDLDKADHALEELSWEFSVGVEFLFKASQSMIRTNRTFLAKGQLYVQLIWPSNPRSSRPPEWSPVFGMHEIQVTSADGKKLRLSPVTEDNLELHAVDVFSDHFLSGSSLEAVEQWTCPIPLTSGAEQFANLQEIWLEMMQGL